MSRAGDRRADILRRVGEAGTAGIAVKTIVDAVVDDPRFGADPSYAFGVDLAAVNPGYRRDIVTMKVANDLRLLEKRGKVELAGRSVPPPRSVNLWRAKA